jgi:N utilization substance protein B
VSSVSKVKSPRRRAVYLYYEALVRDADLLELYDNRSKEVGSYTRDLLVYLSEHEKKISSLIESKLKNRKVSQVAKIDYAIIAVALAELALGDEKHSEVIEQAIQLAKEFGSEDDSYKFVHAMIDSSSAV